MIAIIFFKEKNKPFISQHNRCVQKGPPTHTHTHTQMLLDISNYFSSLLKEAPDPFTDLAKLHNAVEVAELRIGGLTRSCARLRHAGIEAEEVAARKATLVDEWDAIEDTLLAIMRDVAAVSRTTAAAAGAGGSDVRRRRESREKVAEVVRIGQTLTQRVEQLLDRGQQAVGVLSAAGWAMRRPEDEASTPEPFRTDGWLRAVGELEREESRCRFEYEAGEEHVRSVAAQSLASERRKVAFVTTGGGVLPHTPPQPCLASGGGGGGGGRGRGPLCVPLHWVCQGGAAEAGVVDATAEVREAVAAWFEGVGTVTSVARVEAPRQWSEYAARKEEVRRAVGLGRVGVVTETDLMANPAAALPEELEDSVNEKWLLLPLRSEADAQAVATEGLGRLRRTSGLYGPGLYFVESAAQANDSVAGAEPCVVLARVTLGSPAVLDAPRSGTAAAGQEAGSGTTHSVIVNCRELADRRMRPAASSTAWSTGYREFVVGSSSEAYPAYIVHYRKTPASLAFRVSYE